MLCETKSFGQNVGVDLCRCAVAVFEHVVLVVQFGETLGQGKLVPEASVDPRGQLTWCQPAGQHPGGECSCLGFLSGDARVEGFETQLIERRGKKPKDVVVSLCACARGQGSQGRAVESGDEGVAGAGDDIGCPDLADAPKEGTAL
ncbi:hypothetical protein AMK24_30935 [Streptomyces sp. CB02366]|nr:hypothetical protein AMK24_30935 [Streptomyces sp. CB02366]